MLFIKTRQIERIFVVPPIVTMMVKSAESVKYKLNSLKCLLVGAAPLSADLEDQLLRRYPTIREVRQRMS